MLNRNINNDSYSYANHQHEHQSKSILTMPKNQSRKEESINGLLINFDENFYKNNKLKKLNKRMYDEIVAKLSKSCIN